MSRRGGGDVTLERRGAVALLTLDRPEKHNAVTPAMARAGRRLLAEVGADHDVRALVITGAGTHFCAGADIAAYATRDHETIRTLTDDANAFVDEVAGLPVPTVAAVEGMALGGGFEIALATDFIVASEEARLGLPEVALGLVPGWGGTQRLTAAVGPRVARELVLLGRTLDSHQARRHGVITEVAPPTRAVAVALDLAATLAERPTVAMRHARQAIDRAPEGRQLERRLLDELFVSDDGLEGVAAFVAKRRPRFTDR